MGCQPKRCRPGYGVPNAGSLLELRRVPPPVSSSICSRSGGRRAADVMAPRSALRFTWNIGHFRATCSVGLARRLAAAVHRRASGLGASASRAARTPDEAVRRPARPRWRPSVCALTARVFHVERSDYSLLDQRATSESVVWAASAPRSVAAEHTRSPGLRARKQWIGVRSSFHVKRGVANFPARSR